MGFASNNSNERCCRWILQRAGYERDEIASVDFENGYIDDEESADGGFGPQSNTH